MLPVISFAPVMEVGHVPGGGVVAGKVKKSQGEPVSGGGGIQFKTG
jgi:hypothetical protein